MKRDKKKGPTFAEQVSALKKPRTAQQIAQLEAAVAELRAINERLVLDVKRGTEENENLRATQYRD